MKPFNHVQNNEFMLIKDTISKICLKKHIFSIYL